MIKIYDDIKEFIGKDISSEGLEYKFNKDCYLIKVYDSDCELICEKNTGSELFVHGAVSLIGELVYNMVTLGLSFDTYTMSKELADSFNREYTSLVGGAFREISCPIDGYVSMKYEVGNISSCVLAGGCFWCVGKPYYEYDGIIKVFSGYTGGNKVLPKYEEVKSQSTHHLEAIKLIYDEKIISYTDILDIYFETIDPYDDGGQFIDRGESYTTCIYYNNMAMKEEILKYIATFEKKYGVGVAVKVLPEDVFYMAEEHHQDYALKNPELMEKELIESGRKK